MTRIRDLNRKTTMNDNDILPVWDGSTASTRSISFSNLRAAVPYMESVEYVPPNLVLTQSDGNVFNITIPQDSGIIFVSQESDFPTQDANTITLEEGCFYWVTAPITTSKRFIARQNSLLTAGAQGTDNVLTYTGVGSMFTSIDASFTIREMVINHPNAQGFDVLDNAGGAVFVFIDNITSLAGTKIATFNNMNGVVINRSAFVDMQDGISVSGLDFGIFNASTSLIGSTDASFVGVDFGSAILQTLELENVNFQAPVGAIGISGLTNSGNIPTQRLAMVQGCEFGPDITPLQNIAFNDIRWEFSNNNRIKDSRSAADLFLQGGSETITVSSPGVFVEIGVPSAGGVTWESDIQDRFSVGSDGVLTYIGEKDIEAQLIGRATVEKVGGGSNEIEVRLAKNWTPGQSGILKSRAKTQNATPTTVPVSALVSLSTNDNIRLIFSNNTGTSDIIADVSNVEISD